MAEPNFDDLLAQFQSEISQVEAQIPSETKEDVAPKRPRIEDDRKALSEQPRHRVVSQVAASAKAEPVTTISITVPSEPAPEYVYNGDGAIYIDPGN